VSQNTTAAATGDKTIQFSSFYLADSLFGVDIQNIKEINDETNFTRIRHANSEVRGYVNIRGQIYLIFDLRKMLGFEPAEVDSCSKIILFKPHVGASFGVLIDSIGDVIEVAESSIEERNEVSATEDERQLVIGTCKLESQLLTILDSESFLTANEID